MKQSPPKVANPPGPWHSVWQLIFQTADELRARRAAEADAKISLNPQEES